VKRGTLEHSNNAEKVNLLIILEFILCFLIVYFTVTRNASLASMCFSLSFIVLLSIMFKTFLGSSLKHNGSVDVLLLILITFIAFIAVVYSGSSISLSFDYLRKYLFFCSTVIFLFVVSRTEVNKKTISSILIINMVLVTYYIYSYFSGVGRAYFNSYASKYLTFNFTNPNLTAIFLLQSILYLFIAMVFFQSKMIKLLCVVLAVPMTYFLYETEARTCMIALAAYLLLVGYTQFKKTIKFNRLIIVIVTLFPIIIAFAYMYMINNDSMGTLNFMASEGKEVYSRNRVWTYAFEAINAHPMLGAYFQISGGSGISQMHNTHLDVWASYGTYVFLLLMFYLMRIVIRISVGCTTKFQTISLMAFFAVIVMGMGEAAVFSGGQGIYILSCSFLLLARYRSDSDDGDVNGSGG
jgi:hypothetical protein